MLRWKSFCSLFKDYRNSTRKKEVSFAIAGRLLLLNVLAFAEQQLFH